MRHKNYQHFLDLNQMKLELSLESVALDFLYWGFFDGLDWWRNYLHVHSFFEVCFVLKGEGEFRINNASHTVNEGDLFLAKPEERHEIISSKKQPLAILFWSYTVLPKNPESSSELKALFDAFSKSKLAVVHSQHKHLALLSSITDELSRKDSAYGFAVNGLATQLVIETARAFTQLPSHTVQHPETNYQDAVVRTIIRYLHDNYRKPLKLRDIAAQVHLSERHMSRIFRATTKQSIKQYATKLRMATAKQLLLNEATSISDVAYSTGYQDVRHFSTAFRKNTGSSPSAFRAQGGTEFV